MAEKPKQVEKRMEKGIGTLIDLAKTIEESITKTAKFSKPEEIKIKLKGK
jgi:hypothetical protein